MAPLKFIIRRINNNSYESIPSFESGTSFGKHHDGVPSDDENMNLPYLLNPNETDISTYNYDSQLTPVDNIVESETHELSSDSSQGSPFEGFNDSSNGEVENPPYYYNTGELENPSYDCNTGDLKRECYDLNTVNNNGEEENPCYDCNIVTEKAETLEVPPQKVDAAPATSDKFSPGKCTFKNFNSSIGELENPCYDRNIVTSTGELENPCYDPNTVNNTGELEKPCYDCNTLVNTGELENPSYDCNNVTGKTDILEVPPQKVDAAVASSDKFSPGKCTFPKFFSLVVEENSCNAVDVLLSVENVVSQDCAASLGSSVPATDLSFNGRIKKITDSCSSENLPITKELRTSAAQHLPALMEKTLSSSEMVESSFVLKKYRNEKSPDLFKDDDDDDDNVEDNIKANNVGEQTPEAYTFDYTGQDVAVHEEKDQQTQSHCDANQPLNCPTEPSFMVEPTMDATLPTQLSDSQDLLKANCKRDRELLRRTRKCLAGVPPPPTVTTPQLDLITTVLRLKDDILNFHKKEPHSESADSCSTTSLFKPTHTLEETQSMGWKDILGVRQHGLSFNLSKASESSEYLSLSVVERFIGAETASSCQVSPSSTKKRIARLKMLTASPGSRLSHLAKRRSVFSSAHLATTIQKSTLSLGTQIQLDKKKMRNRRKGTPKRRTPASKKKNVRKTPSSSARKRLQRTNLINPGQARENSRRALFQSPAKTLQPQKDLLPKPIVKPEIATRVEKSKRALFSPDNSLSSTIEGIANSSQADQNHCTSSRNLESLLLKRKRNCDDDADEGDVAELATAHSSKVFRGNGLSLTPRALKIKSQSFCIGAGSSSKNSYDYAELCKQQLAAAKNLSGSEMFCQNNVNSNSSLSAICKLVRAQSDNTRMVSNSLTENQRKKLLWAVSQALQEKKITTKHESFKEYASVLARVVRRIFQEYYQKNSTSNSETMLRLAKKYVYNVISGKNADDIYFHAKAQIDESNRKSSSRLVGYIAPEVYENIKASQQQRSQFSNTLSQRTISKGGSLQSVYGMENSLDSFSLGFSQTSSFAATTPSCTLTSQSQTNTQELQRTQDQLLTAQRIFDVQSQDLNQQQQEKCAPIQPNPALQNSSSKNNFGSLALRENIDCEQRRSAQKNFTGKDQRNMSPYAAVAPSSRLGSATKVHSSVRHDLFIVNAAKAKRQITFDN